MIRRILLAAAVLGAAIFWANCSFNPRRVDPSEPWNTFFAGCFEGAPTDNPKPLKIVLVPGSSDFFTLSGCLQFSADQATLAGQVDASDHDQAQLTVMPTAGGPSYAILVVRQPNSQEAAVTVSVSNLSGAPFQSAPDLTRCADTSADTCEELMIPLAFMPGGGMP